MPAKTHEFIKLRDAHNELVKEHAKLIATVEDYQKGIRSAETICANLRQEIKDIRAKHEEYKVKVKAYLEIINDISNTGRIE